MSLQAAMLRNLFLVVATAIVWNGPWLLMSDQWAPVGTTLLICLAVWAYDVRFVREDFEY